MTTWHGSDVSFRCKSPPFNALWLSIRCAEPIAVVRSTRSALRLPARTEASMSAWSASIGVYASASTKLLMMS